jgi:hypothetical protein
VHVHQRGLVVERQRLELDRVNEAEDGSIRANPERHRADDDEGR